MMKITWLGQAGLLFETDGLKIMIDPYLSDSVEKLNPAKKRRVPVDDKFLKINPDVIICTHDHIDHTDPETLEFFLNGEKKVDVLAPFNARETARKFGNGNNYILFNRHTEVSIGNVLFKAVKAEHSDLCSVGVIIEEGGKRYYITGDTLYNTEIFEDIPFGVDALFLPVNGEGNNMNMQDAKRFAEKINPKAAIPLHWGLLDDIDIKEFTYEKALIPKIYEEIII